MIVWAKSSQRDPTCIYLFICFIAASHNNNFCILCATFYVEAANLHLTAACSAFHYSSHQTQKLFADVSIKEHTLCNIVKASSLFKMFIEVFLPSLDRKMLNIIPLKEYVSSSNCRDIANKSCRLFGGTGGALLK